jgi:hypothetical protein
MGAERDAADDKELERQDSLKPLGPTIVDRVGESAVDGITKAVFETKDFLVGEPLEENKSGFRQRTEAASRARRRKGVGYSLIEGVSQFATGMIGAGKLMAPLKIAQKGKKAKIAAEVGRGAIAGAVVLDPHEERLSNLIQSVPALENPISDYLQAQPGDSAAEGRLKNALEGIGMDVAIVGVFALTVKGLKLARAGKTEEAAKVLQQVQTLETERAAKPRVRIQADVRHIPDEVSVEVPAGQVDEAVTPSVLPEQEVLPPNGQPAGVSPVEPPVSTVDDTLPVTTNSVEVSTPSEVLTQAEKSKPYRSRTDISPEELGGLLKSADEDMAALSKYGSREAAIEAGHKFAGEGALPWGKLSEGTDSVRTFVDNVAATVTKRLDKLKGGSVLSDSRVQDMVRQRAAIWGEDPEFILGQIAKAGEEAKTMVANMEAGYLIAQRMWQDAYDVAYKLRNGLTDQWEGGADEAAEELRQMIMAAVDLTGSARSVSSNSGRALRRMRREFQIKPEDVERVASMDADQLSDIIFRSKGDPRKLAELANPSVMQKIMDEAGFSLVNSLLWLYPTHLVNTTTNFYMLVARPTEKLLGSLALSVAKNPQAGALRKQAMKEYTYTLAALGDAWEAAMETFMRGDSILTPHGVEYFDPTEAITQQGRIKWREVKGVDDVFANLWSSLNYRTIVGLPTRALGTMDEFFKTMRYRAIIQARAATDANTMGLTGDAFKKHMERSMTEAFDSAGRGMDTAALKEAQTTTFQQELLPNTLGSGLRNLRSNYQPIQFVLPFIKTPINVLRYGWKMTPGLNLLQGEYRQMISGAMGSEAQAQAIGQMSMGTIFMGLAANMALQGRTTGGGPKDYKVKKELLATGWKPYSYVLEGKDGTKTYVPFGRFDPVGMVMGMVTDVMEANLIHPGQKETDGALGAILLSVVQNINERTFLMSFTQLLRAVGDPEGSLPKYLGGQVANTMPLSSLIRGTNPDDTMRETRGFLDTALKNLPGFSDSLPPVRDAFGDPVARTISLTSTQEADLVESEHNRIILETGKGITPPTPRRNGVDLRDIRLEDGRTAYDRLQELAGRPVDGGKTLKEALADLIKSDAYQDLVDGESSVKGTKLYALNTIVTKYREAAFNRLQRENPAIREALLADRKATVDALRAKRSEGQEAKPAEELLKQLGY